MEIQLDICPERSFLTQMYFLVQTEYQKQPPKMESLYLDRLRPTPGLIMPTVRSYSLRDQELGDILGRNDHVYTRGMFTSGKDYVGRGLHKKEYGILDKNGYGSGSLGYSW